MHPTERCVAAVRAALLGGLTALAMLAGALATTPAPALADDSTGPTGPTGLYLVTLSGPGAAGSTDAVPLVLREVRMRVEQDRTLAAVNAPAPTYRWTTALNGYAVRLTSSQARSLEGVDDVASVEPNEVRPLAGTASGLSASGASGASALVGERLGADDPASGGAGVVIGVVDSGLSPESPLFAQVRHGRTASSFSGTCPGGQDWSESECNGKLAGARWYVEGFGVERLSSTSSLSPRDTDGHGTQMASIAAGNAGVPVVVGGERLGRLGGLAPDAQVAVYKACWGAPDPDDDGCATADLVTAIDDATRDGVDVLSLSVGGPGEIDTVERALLGATESGVVVVAAAGNGGQETLAAHPGPWVTTIGGTTGELRQGRVEVPRALRTPKLADLTGAMLSRRTVGPAPVVLGEDVAVDGVRPRESRICAPGSLDAAQAADAIVVCERGQVGRTDKSRAVALADGAGMVLVNRRRESVDLDVHSVPTVHLDVAAGALLERWVRAHRGAELTLHSLGLSRRPARVADLSASGNLATGTLKPDALAPATGVLGAVPAAGGADGWAFANGTSAATAYTAGVAARLLGRENWTAAEVRSALVTTARPVGRASVLRTGAGRVRPDRVSNPGLAYLVKPDDYRAWLDGEQTDLNTPSILMTGDEATVTRTVTNTSGRRLYFSSSARGFDSDIVLTPAALRLGPGESATYTLTVERRSPALDDGYVVWRGARGTVTRIAVVIGR